MVCSVVSENEVFLLLKKELLCQVFGSIFLIENKFETINLLTAYTVKIISLVLVFIKS